MASRKVRDLDVKLQYIQYYIYGGDAGIIIGNVLLSSLTLSPGAILDSKFANIKTYQLAAMYRQDDLRSTLFTN